MVLVKQRGMGIKKPLSHKMWLFYNKEIQQYKIIASAQMLLCP